MFFSLITTFHISSRIYYRYYQVKPNFKFMKGKKLFYLVLSGFLLLTISSCNKKDKNNDSPIPSKWTSASIDDNKATIEDNGIQMVQQMQDVTNLQTSKVLANFATISSNGAFMSNKAVSTSLTPFKMLVNNKNLDTKSVSDGLKSAVQNNSGQFTDAWQSVVGRYTYNSDSSKFIKSALSNEVIIEFPGKSTDTTNTGTITINNFTTHDAGIKVNNGDSIDLSDIPATIHADLKYNGTTLSTFDYSATGASGELFTSASFKWTIEDFSMELTGNHTPNTDASTTYSFKHGDTTLVESHAEVKGDWNQSNIDANTHVTTDTVYFTDYNPNTGQWFQNYTIDTNQEVYFENIIQNANAYIQVFNIKVAGLVDIKSLGTAMRNLDTTLTDEQYIKQQSDLFNKYAQLAVVDAKDNSKISTAEAYAYQDPQSGDWSMEMRFVFADGSKIDPDTYFKTGFQNLIDQINLLIDDINNDYQTSIQHVQP